MPECKVLVFSWAEEYGFHFLDIFQILTMNTYYSDGETSSFLSPFLLPFPFPLSLPPSFPLPSLPSSLFLSSFSPFPPPSLPPSPTSPLSPSFLPLPSVPSSLPPQSLSPSLSSFNLGPFSALLPQFPVLVPSPLASCSEWPAWPVPATAEDHVPHLEFSDLIQSACTHCLLPGGLGRVGRGPKAKIRILRSFRLWF